MDTLPGDLIEKISLILGDRKVFHTMLNTNAVLIRRGAQMIERAKDVLIRKGWWQNGQMHREDDQPRIIFPTGQLRWFDK